MATHPIVPPAPKVHANELPVWRLLFEIRRNTLGIWPDYAFDKLINRRQVLSIDSLLVNDPEGVRQVLTTGANKYIRPIATSRVMRPLVGQGVFLAEGAEWRRQRRMLAPTFTPASVNLLLPHFIEAADELIRQVERARRANLAITFQQVTLEAVLRALFSLPDSQQRNHLGVLVHEYLAGPGRPTILDGFAKTEDTFSIASRGRRAFQAKWTAAVDKIIAERRKTPASDQHRDLLDLLIAARDPETGQTLDDAEIRDQCATMILAGYETTARTLFWATYLLTLDTREQERLRKEVTDFAPHRVTSMDDLAHWPRLRQTILEALRIYPPAPQITREAIAEDVVMGEEVKPGTQIWISPWVIHRHRKLWDHPTAFMPERFSGKPTPWGGHSPYLPFGSGPRICIGAMFAIVEAQIMLATLLSRYKITLDDPRPVTPVGAVLIAPNYEPLFTIEHA